jgi:hypothetical protein
VSASAPQLPLQLEDAMRNEDAEVTEVEGALKMIRVNQVKATIASIWLLSILELKILYLLWIVIFTFQQIFIITF